MRPRPGCRAEDVALVGLGSAAGAIGISFASDSGISPALTWAKGQIGARWLANDDNGDAMMERFKAALSGIFAGGKKRPKEAEADAEEVMEGGIPPTDGEGDE